MSAYVNNGETMKTLNKVLELFRNGLEIDHWEFYKDMIEDSADFELVKQSKGWEEFLSYEN